MPWLPLASFFFGGAFLANAIPHVVSGMMGRPFQSPFAKPPGQGFSSSTVNVLWGFFNTVVSYMLVCRVGDFDLRSTADVVAFGAGAFLIALFLARQFGRFNGGNTPGAPVTAPVTGVFRSLRGFNYRVWTGGAFVSNVGTWVQRTAQDWLVLTQLTDHDASAVGLVMALQFGPQLLLLPWTGFAADHFNQRKLLIATQATMGALALALGALTVTGIVQLWQVYVFAFLFGCAAAFDAPVRQTFVAELVGDDDLHNAVALNSTSFNAARMIGPAVAGLVIAAIGTGWAFLINGASFVAVLISLSFLRVAELRPNARADRARGSFTAGFRYVGGRPDLKAILIILFLIGTFGLNFPIFISTMAVSVFHADARGFGLLSSIMAIGTVAGALLSANREKPRFSLVLVGAAIFGIGCTLAAIAPGYWFFAAALVLIGVAALTVTNTTNSLMQLSTTPAMRGRVMALRVGIALGGTPIGAPIVGWVANNCGARWALGVGAASGFAAAMVAVFVLTRGRKRPQS